MDPDSDMPLASFYGKRDASRVLIIGHNPHIATPTDYTGGLTVAALSAQKC
jgi:hypothetical protein